jgi:hypothetical protein
MDRSLQTTDSTPLSIGLTALKFAVKFCLVMLVASVPLTLAWEWLFPGKIYYSIHTDDMFGGYLSPGEWLRGSAMQVSDVSAAAASYGQPPTDLIIRMDSGYWKQPELIKRGWSVPILWGVWLIMFGASSALGVAGARLHWASSDSPPLEPEY